MHHKVLAIWPPLVLTLIAALVLPILPKGLAFLAVAFIVLMVLDALARLEEYDNVTRAISRSDAPIVTLNYFARRHRTSWCQREMLKAAAGSLGLRSTADCVFRAQGYRWYHIFPDNTFSVDCPFLKKAFWAGMVGLKRA